MNSAPADSTTEEDRNIQMAVDEATDMLRQFDPYHVEHYRTPQQEAVPEQANESPITSPTVVPVDLDPDVGIDPDEVRAPAVDLQSSNVPDPTPNTEASDYELARRLQYPEPSMRELQKREAEAGVVQRMFDEARRLAGEAMQAPAAGGSTSSPTTTTAVNPPQSTATNSHDTHNNTVQEPPVAATVNNTTQDWTTPTLPSSSSAAPSTGNLAPAATDHNATSAADDNIYAFAYMRAHLCMFFAFAKFC